MSKQDDFTVPHGDYLPIEPGSRLHRFFEIYATIREAKNLKEQELDIIDADLTNLKEQIIPIMVELEYQSVNFSGIKYWLSVSGRPSIVPETRADFIGWLKDNNEDGLIQTDYVNPNTLWGWKNNLPEALKEELVSLGYLKVNEDIQLKSPKDYKRKRKKR